MVRRSAFFFLAGLVVLGLAQSVVGVEEAEMSEIATLAEKVENDIAVLEDELEEVQEQATAGHSKTAAKANSRKWMKLAALATLAIATISSGALAYRNRDAIKAKISGKPAIPPAPPAPTPAPPAPSGLGRFVPSAASIPVLNRFLAKPAEAPAPPSSN